MFVSFNDTIWNHEKKNQTHEVVLGQQQKDDWPVMLQQEENPWGRKKLGSAAKLQREKRVLTAKGSDTKLRK